MRHLIILVVSLEMVGRVSIQSLSIFAMSRLYPSSVLFVILYLYVSSDWTFLYHNMNINLLFHLVVIFTCRMTCYVVSSKCVTELFQIQRGRINTIDKNSYKFCVYITLSYKEVLKLSPLVYLSDQMSKFSFLRNGFLG